MKIACIISSLRLGGAERQLLYLAATLQQAGHDAELITYHDNIFYSNILDKLRLPHTLILKRHGSITLARDLAAHLKAGGFHAAIAFMPGSCLKACLAHMIYPGFRLFVSERNFNTHLGPHDLLRFALFRSQAEKVICNNHSQEAFIRRHYPALSDKVLTISNFVDGEYFQPQPHIPGQVRRIVCVARMSRRKNLHGLIEAAAILKRGEARFEKARATGFDITLVGAEGDSRYLRKCMALVRKHGLQDCFHIEKASTNIAAEYHKADIFCLPSFYEGTCNALAEALACGLPVVCSDVSDNGLYVQEGINGFLCDPHSAASIADALGRALDCPASRLCEMGQQSRKTAISKLSQRDYTEKYLKILG